MYLNGSIDYSKGISHKSNQMKKLTGGVMTVTTNDQDMIGTLHSLACHEATALPSSSRTIVLTIFMVELP